MVSHAVLFRAAVACASLLISATLFRSLVRAPPSSREEPGAEGGSSLAAESAAATSPRRQFFQEAENQQFQDETAARKDAHYLPVDREAEAAREVPTLEGTSNAGDSSSGGDAEEEQQQQPNVIFILIDDVGTNDIGYQSTDLWELTPFMDSLSSEGVRLTKYYTNQLCTPSRASLMTGRDTFRTGMQYEVVEDSGAWGLPLEEVTLAERFKTGKWHLGMYSDAHYPFARGFDTFLGYMGAVRGYSSHEGCNTPTFEGGEYSCFKDFGYGDKDGYINHITNTTRQGPSFVGNYSTTIITDRAIEVAKEHGEDPFFLYVSHQAVHSPVDPPPDDYFTEEEHATLARVVSEDAYRQRFARVILFLDKEMRRLHDELDALGALDNTVLVVASDNGACPTAGGSNYPLRGYKHTIFEGGVRVPAFVYSKSTDLIPEEARGTRYSGMMHSTDWTPTFGSVVPDLPLGEMGKELSGFDHWDAIIGGGEGEGGGVRTELVLGRSSYVFDLDAGEIVNNPRCTGWSTFSLDDPVISEDPGCDLEDACTSCTVDCGGPELIDFLFHIDTDPYETENLRDSMPEKYAEMVQRFEVSTNDEVVAEYKPAQPQALERWDEFNHWMVAWL
ncbi:Formylglycine-dependent sulfatase [Ectocarpus siliculosus]|uniref:Formylglycine-dependent sulfatase n=1 Tax=Ectocarpus siliculosus TaxID=2880 RepID=D7FLS1_ECTSI|nr:Formylglycine-dependent sulfatase [Ectocarpus siliculosus]|eukprot:CBJ29746.1 Formylglycine-dependent sulfatase [Ectocarpus siliculosus]